MEALLALIVDGKSLFGGKPKIMEIETPRRQKHNVITGKYYIIHVITLLKCPYIVHVLHASACITIS